MHNQPGCCLGLFAAADALGFGFVRGTPAHIYLESLTLDSLNRLGLAIEKSDRVADVIVRIPSQPEAIFRAAVTAAQVFRSPMCCKCGSTSPRTRRKGGNKHERFSGGFSSHCSRKQG
jgi:hypothetical protein